MAPGKARSGLSLADQLAELEDPTPKDFDPEDIDGDVQSSGEEGVTKQSDLSLGREHYQSVGKGKLRKQTLIDLGKQYEAARVSRDDLNADSDDDPFAARTDDELSSDQDDHGDSTSESESPSDEDLAATGAGIIDDDQSDESSDDHDGGLDGIGAGDAPQQDNHAEQSEKGVDVHDYSGHKHQDSDGRDELRRLMASDQKTIAATISQAAKADAVKGKAVKEQRTTFDALLNARIKMQKGLAAMNEMVGIVVDEEEEGEEEKNNSEAIKSAENAAIALWSTLEDLRIALADAHAKDGAKKRKRAGPINSTTSTTTLWERMSNLESESLLHRRAVLDKWSSKVRGTAASLPNARGKLLGSASGTQTITAVLDAHVATELGDRASKRARQTSAPNGSTPSEQHEPVYDDTIFYQSLLRDLVEQRMSSSEAMTGGLDTLHQLPSRLPIHPITGMRNDKNRKEVDTRASKGRKMRFNVHEKLQNFMAPEDRGSWTIRARDEFFASLLGKSASGLLGEGDESASDVESDEDREEGGLRLFRS